MKIFVILEDTFEQIIKAFEDIKVRFLQFLISINKFL